jgi:hypothetical protein
MSNTAKTTMNLRTGAPYSPLKRLRKHTRSVSQIIALSERRIIMELIKKRAANLLTIKSIVTIAMTALVIFLAVRGDISGEQVNTIFTVVIGFYFGTQASKTDTGGGGNA